MGVEHACLVVGRLIPHHQIPPELSVRMSACWIFCYPTLMNTQTLRQQIKQRRQTLSVQAQEHAAAAIVARLQQCQEFAQAHRVAFYWPHDGEVSLVNAMTTSPNNNKHYYLPICHDSTLLFAEWTKDTKLQPNQYGILEPHTHHVIAATDLDVVCVPLVAFTADCHRLGMGKAYYDRTFAFRQQQHSHPVLIGIAYEWQKQAKLPQNAWDVPMDIIITDQQQYRRIK